MNIFIILTIFGSIALNVVESARIVINEPRQNSGIWATLDKKQPIIAGHRGEKVLMPEHTLGSYEIAAIEGADYVEPDLVLTLDGKFVCFHDLSLRAGTNVAQLSQFASKMRNFTHEVNGMNQTITNDWFIHDFTLAELKEIRVMQVVRGIRPQYFNDLFEIPTFEEYLDVIHKMSYLQNQSIGIIPELKSPNFHNSLWSENYMENLLLTTLTQYGYPVKQGDVATCKHNNNGVIVDIQCGDVIIQSFDINCIRYLHTQTNVDLLMLANPTQLEQLTFNGIKDVADVAQHFHLSKELLHTGILAALRRYNYTYNETYIASLGGFIPPEQIVEEGHKLNLKIGIYTIYDSHENSNRGCDIECEPQDKELEMFYFFEMGVDGFFVENLQEALELRMKFDNKLQIEQLQSSGSNIALSRGVIYLMFLVFSVMSSKFW